jgi:hypothetical protein
MPSDFLPRIPFLRRALRPVTPSPQAAAAAQRAHALAVSVERLRRHRVTALRDWLGEDHELVRDMPRPAAAPR